MATNSQPVAALDPLEQLTESFYVWERRGRGWQVWPAPIDLEPPFEPFRWRRRLRTPVGTDDGRRPTALGHLMDLLTGTERGVASESVSPGPDLVPTPWASTGAPVELVLKLPEECGVSSEAAERLLLSLPQKPCPVAFEVIGTRGAITFQLTSPPAAAALVEAQVTGLFPEASLAGAPKRLAEQWSAGPTDSLVVEFGLASECMLPVQTFRRFEPDPLTAAVALLRRLGGGEIGVLQVLFQPVRNDWGGSIMRAVLDDEGAPFFLDAPEVTQLAREKVSRPLYACVIRVAAGAASRARSTEIARGLSWALGVYANPAANRLIPLVNDGYPDGEHLEDLLQRRSRRSGMLLGATELAGFVHPPSPSIRVEELVRRRGITRAAPSIAVGKELVLGQNEHDGRTTRVSLGRKQRMQHTYVVGASGTGKSTLLLNMIIQDLEQGQGLALFDPHGDLVDEVLRRCPAKRLDDVVLLDPADANHPIGFNILSAHSELERTLLSSDLVSVFRRLSTSWGDQMTAVLGNAILAMLESEHGGTLLTLRRFLVEPAFRKQFLQSVRDPEVVYFWTREFPLLAGKPQGPLLTRLNTFLRPRTIRYMVAQKDSRLDLRTLMDNGGVVLARLSQGAIGEENASLLGALLVSKIHQLAISRQELDPESRRPFYLYVDEFHHFVTPSMEGILSGARKYGLGLILAHQDLRQVQGRSPEVFNSVLSNPYTRVCFRVGDQDARLLAPGFGHFGASQLQSLGTGEAIARIERSEFDFNLQTAPLEPLDAREGARRREAIVTRSRQVFARPRGEIEALLQGTQGDPKAVEVPLIPERPLDKTKAAAAPSEAVPPGPAGTIGSEVEPAGPALSAAARPTSSENATRGRGGKQHRYLQELIRRWGASNGWGVSLEESVLSGLGCVDVVIRKNDVAIACEIAVTSPPEHELENILKCLSAGFDHVVSVAPEKRRLSRIRKLARSQLAQEQLTRIHFAPAESVLDVLATFEPPPTERVSTVRGYRVRVRAADDDSSGHRQIIAGVLAKALTRLRGK